MKNRVMKSTAAVAALMAWSTGAWAGCNNAEIVGNWDVTFSDGNSCVLRLDRGGEVIAGESICFDPFRGSTAPDSGNFAVASDCSINLAIVVEGATVELEGRITRSRDSGAGRYLVPAFFVKGAFTMIRMP